METRVSVSKRELIGIGSWPFTCAVHALGVAACVMVLVWCIHFRGGLAFEATNMALVFNLHPVFTLVGFVFLGSEAILVYRVLPGTKWVRKIAHSTLHLLALAFGIIGTYEIIRYHTALGYDNFTNVHSWLGMAALLLYAAVWIMGFTAFWYPSGTDEQRAATLPWHIVFGLSAYMVAVLTSVLGLLEKLTHLEADGLGKYSAEAFLVNFTAIAVVLLGTSVVFSSITTPTPPTQCHMGYKNLAEDGI